MVLTSGGCRAFFVGPAKGSSADSWSPYPWPIHETPAVLPLDDERARDPGSTGAKAANLARAAVGGLPVLPGFALTTASFDPAMVGRPDSRLPGEVESELRVFWRRLVDGDETPLVVRSSSTIEDIGESSMAGQFTSLLDVRGWSAFLDAVHEVLASARTATPGEPPLPMAVLVQRELAAVKGGVLFGLDPVTGDRDQVTAEVVPGGPEKLVSGTVTAAAYHLGRRGRLLDTDDESDPLRLDRRERRQLVRLARDARALFGRPQDVEWAYDGSGELWLLQSRPVTAAGELHTATGPVLGPGPVGETFPDPLGPLEEDLWIAPLREGIIAALRVTGAVSRKRIRRSPVVVTVGRRVACDLELLGVTPEKRSAWRWLDPRQPARRVLGSWRIGRLRAVLPRLVLDVLRRTDGQLAEVPALEDLTDEQLLGLLERTRRLLVSLHGHEVLSATLLDKDEVGPTAAGLALTAVANGRRHGWSDDRIVARSPVALVLVAPNVGPDHALPEVPPEAVQPGDLADLSAREGLRLRARWVQELSARAAEELGRRLARTGSLPDEDAVVWAGLDRLSALVESDGAGPAVEAPAAAGPPLPSAFRLTGSGTVAPVRERGHHPGGRGAGGGRGEGPVVHGSARRPPPQGAVLVVRNLEPGLAGALPRLSGLVAETGSMLSHLAILAREYGVPTVVGVHDALHRFPEGTRLVVDGDTGDVSQTERVTEQRPMP